MSILKHVKGMRRQKSIFAVLRQSWEILDSLLFAPFFCLNLPSKLQELKNVQSFQIKLAKMVFQRLESAFLGGNGHRSGVILSGERCLEVITSILKRL